MIINQPSVRTTDGHSFLTSMVTDERTGITKEIYFSVPVEYGQYLAPEVADAFVVAMLLPAVVSGQNITVKAPISDRLFFQSGNALIYLFAKLFNTKPICLYPEKTIEPDFRPAAVATGFSGGVDSFYTVKQHTSPQCPASLKLTHLTLFNVGAYGNREETSEAFQRDSQRAAAFSKQINLPLVLLDSNISTMHNHPDIFPFSTRMFNNIMAGVLALQKLFSIYLLSSGVPADFTKVDPRFRDQGWHDVLLAHFFSGSNTRLLISGSSVTRLDKIKYITGSTDAFSLQSVDGNGVNGAAQRSRELVQPSAAGPLPEKRSILKEKGTEPVAETAEPVAADNAPAQETYAGISFSLVQKNLYVCQADVYNEKYGFSFKKDTSPNCSECDKCTRTLLALELLGRLDDFKSQFDLQKWQRVKYKRLAKDLANYKTDPFAREMLDLAKAQSFPMPLKSKLIAFKMRTRKQLKQVQLLRKLYRIVVRKREEKSNNEQSF